MEQIVDLSKLKTLEIRVQITPEAAAVFPAHVSVKDWA
jgi:hypothetical protein